MIYSRIMNMKIKNTKIVATLGPASAKEDVLEKMFKEGLNVIRMNFQSRRPSQPSEESKSSQESC
jgi:pyruvate kinase